MTEGELLKELLETFRLEAQEHLDALAALLIALERADEGEERAKLVESAFRRMHTLKGAAHAVNLGEVAQLCQDLEGLLSDLKRGTLPLELSLFDRMHRDLDLVTARIFVTGGSKPRPVVQPAATCAAKPAKALAAAPDATAAGAAHPAQQAAPDTQPAPAVQPPAPPPPHPAAAGTAPAAEPARAPERPQVAAETVRVPARLLESLLLQAEELVSAKLAAAALTEELAALTREISGRAAQRSRAQEVCGAALRKSGAQPGAVRLAGMLQESCASEKKLDARLQGISLSAERNLRALRGMVDPLLEEMKQLHLLPFATLTDPFSKLVRDLSRELGKEAEFAVTGAQLEIDRRILTELKEPLLHLVRNVMDHGIELPQQRRAAGKPPRGSLFIDFRLLDANHAELSVTDDGKGIDPDQVKATALRQELITPEAAERLGNSDALQLIFESGFSTSPMITALSGRGVGLAIVREALERLGGQVRVDSQPGKSCVFTMTLPLSFALIQGLMVQVSGRNAILPAASVELTCRVPRTEIRTLENRETVRLSGELFSLVSLAGVLDLARRRPEDEPAAQQVVLVKAADRRMAFAVDEVLGVQELLVKPLGSQLPRVRNVSAATVLGNGLVVPILSVNDLMRSALAGAAPTLGSTAPGRTRPRQLSVLVAEDSITSRTLLKNILESSGFRVSTAFDGADALSQLKTGTFDVVVSDVEMPRLDGFQLTAAIRAESRWAQLPVILVTGLESRSDRERGIEVGANAYVVKSSFDQSNLIDVIERLT